MPESGSVVKALEWFVTHSHEDVCSCSCTMNTDPNGFAEEALPMAREQEALLRAYMEAHRVARRQWALMEGDKVLLGCPCDLCECTRKVLP